MKKLLSLLTVLACAITNAVAEEASAAKLALARDAIAAMQVDKILQSMTDQINEVAAQQVQLPETATSEQRQQFDVFMAKVTALARNEVGAVFGKLDAIYANVYTEAELKAIVGFFNSPEGKSVLAKQPEVMSQLMPLMQEMQESLMPKLQKLGEDLEAQVKAGPPAPP